MNTLSFYQLKNIAEDFGIDSYNKNKPELYRILLAYFSEQEKELVPKCEYKRIKQIGQGDGNSKVYLTKKGRKDCVMKIFKSSIKPSEIKKEVQYQNKAVGISPKIIDVDYKDKFVVMEKMDSHVVDYITEMKGNFPIKHQKRLIEIFTTLDEKKIYQADPNLLNYMLKNDKVYMIDFGMCKPINTTLVKKLGTSKPNMKYTLLAFVCKLKEGNCNPKSYSHLLKFID